MPDPLDIGRILSEVGGLKAQQTRADEDRRDMKQAVEKLTMISDQMLGEIRKVDGKVDLIAQKQINQDVRVETNASALFGTQEVPGIAETLRGLYEVVHGGEREDGMLKTLHRLEERDVKRNAILGFFAAVGSALLVVASLLAVPWDKVAKFLGH